MKHDHHRFVLSSILVLVLISVSFGENLAAQETTSEVTGTVSDENGAAIPRAEITFKNDSSNITTDTDLNGRFRLSLHSGNYVATIVATGFKVAKFLDFQLQAPNSASLNVVLSARRVYADPVVPYDLSVPLTTSDLSWLIEEPPPPPAVKSSSAPSKYRGKSGRNRKGCAQTTPAK